MKKPPEFLANMGLKEYHQLLKMVLVLTIRSNKGGGEAQEITAAVCGSALTLINRGSFVSFKLNHLVSFHYDSLGHDVSGDFDDVPWESSMCVTTINVYNDGTANIDVFDIEGVDFNVGRSHITVNLEVGS